MAPRVGRFGTAELFVVRCLVDYFLDSLVNVVELRASYLQLAQNNKKKNGARLYAHVAIN
jgi:hypothetical protein